MNDLAWTLLVAFLFDLSSHASRPLVSLQMVAMGSLPGEIGLLFAAASLLPLAATIPMGRLADRIGPVRMIGMGVVTASLGYLGMALAPASFAVAAAYGVMWVGVTTVAIAQQMFIAGLGAPDRKEQNLGWLGTANAAGQLLGPAIGGILAHTLGLRQVFVWSALVGLLPLLALRQLALSRATGRRPAPAAAASRGSWISGSHLFVNGELRLVFLVAFLVVLALDVRSSFLPVYLNALGFSKATIGMLFSGMATAGILGRVSIGWLSRRLGNWRLLALAISLAVPALLLLPLASRVGAVAVAICAMGVAFGVTQILTIAITARAVDPAQRGTALGVRMSVQMMSMLLSPLLLGALATALGLGAVFLGAGGFMALASGAAMRGAAVAAAKRHHPDPEWPLGVR